MAADGRCCDAELQTGAQLLSRQGRIITIVDLIEEGKVDLVINTPRGRGARTDGYEIRRAAVRRGVPTITTRGRCAGGGAGHGVGAPGFH